MERFVDLIVQIDPVCDQHDFMIRNIRPQRNSFRQEDHGEGLTAALSMPDHTAGSSTFRIAFIDPAHDLLNAEILLVAGDFLFAGIKEGKAIRQFKQPFRPAKRVNGSILRGDNARQVQTVDRFHAVLAREGVVQRLNLAAAQWLIYSGFNGFFELAAFLFPDAPELGRGTDRAVFSFIAGDCQQQLGILKQDRDFIFFLIADLL